MTVRGDILTQEQKLQAIAKSGNTALCSLLGTTAPVFNRVMAKTFSRIPHYIPTVSQWFPRLTAAVKKRFSNNPAQKIIVRDVEDLMQVIYLAQMKNQTVKFVGGSYPINDKNCDCIVSAQEMKSVVAFNADKAWLIVEAGAKLGDILLFLRARGYTFPLYGSVPDLAITDALAVGSTASNGSLPQVVQSCHLVQPDGNLCRVEWTAKSEAWDVVSSFSQYSFSIEHFSSGPSESGDTQHLTEANEVFSDCSISTNTNTQIWPNRIGLPRPTLDDIICGLGLFGAVGLCTLKCVDLHLALEDTQILTLREMIHNRHNFASCLYVKIRCFPLIGKFLVTKAVSVPPHMADWQPVWKSCVEKMLITAYSAVACVSPFVAFYYPRGAHALSDCQFRLLSWALTMRKNCCFWPQRIVPAKSVCRGEQYVLRDNHLSAALRGVVSWADRYRHLATKPIKLSLQTQLEDNNKGVPILAPGGRSYSWTLWTDYFSGLLASWPKRTAHMEFNHVMSRVNASRCWSAAPVRLAQHSHPALGRVQVLRRELGTARMFKSAYIEDDFPSDTEGYDTLRQVGSLSQ